MEQQNREEIRKSDMRRSRRWKSRCTALEVQMYGVGSPDVSLETAQRCPEVADKMKMRHVGQIQSRDDAPWERRSASMTCRI
jgi:hypothetical protein